MKELNDMELDGLIMASIERKETLDDLNETIVKEVRRQARREWVRRWARVVVFSFGMPLLMLIFAAGIYAASRMEELQVLRYFLLIPVLAMSYMIWHEMKSFSIAEV